MPDYKEFLKSGWHPEKEGTTLKGQVKGVFKRNSSPPRREASKPISALRDPSTFAPPPKRIGSGGGGGASAPPPPYRVDASEPDYQEAQADGQRPPEPQPYRVDTTGLSTSHLPPPPGRVSARPPPPPPPGCGGGAGRGPPPALPPRLPPRNTVSSAASSPASTPPAGLLSEASSQVSGLRARFGKLTSGGPGSSAAAPLSTSSPPAAAAEGTTWAQKQAALRTASQFQKDPSSVSLADARSAASTANNFRQRHGEQVASGMQTAGKLEEKYKIADKVGKYAGSSSQGTPPGGSGTSSSTGLVSSTNFTAAAGLLGKKKPPPPPPPKRRDLSGIPSNTGDAPPPVPMSTRPGL